MATWLVERPTGAVEPGHVLPVLRRPALGHFLLAADLLAFLLASIPAGINAADLLMLAVAVAVFSATGLYRARLALSWLDDLPYLLAGVLAGAVTRLAVAAAGGLALPARLGREMALFAGLVVAVRLVAYALARQVRARGLAQYSTLILGAGQVGVQLGRALVDHRELGLHVVGYLSVEPQLEDQVPPAPVLGGYDRLAEVIWQHRVRNVIVAFGTVTGADLVDLLRTCDRLDCEIFFVPRLFELQHTTRDMDWVWGVPLVRLRRRAFRASSWRLKRLFDVVVSGLGLLLLAPVLALIALAVRLDGGPGILFRQERVGLDGRSFTLLKFRSLRPADDRESQLHWSVTGDPRLRPVGRFLRRTSLDELPQLVNVLRGDMSLVGPRPERPYFVDRFAQDVPRYQSRLRVPAGVTGWSQIHGLRGDTSIAERASFDNYYVENWSLWGDVKIVLRTVASIFARPGG